MRRRQIFKRGFHLCILVCGKSGTGKSTFINSLCDVDPKNQKTSSNNIEMDIHTNHIRKKCLLNMQLVKFDLKVASNLLV